MPFVAHGPGGQLFRDARTVWDLPELIQLAMTDGCLENSCKKQRPEKTVALPSLELSLPQEAPRKRVGRATPKAEMVRTFRKSCKSKRRWRIN